MIKEAVLEIGSFVETKVAVQKIKRNVIKRIIKNKE